jgi:hypothetical protein
MAGILNNNLTLRRGQVSLGGAPAQQALGLALYVNQLTPGPADAIAVYTICSLPGYANVQLNNANWTNVLNAGVYVWSYPTVSWTFTGGGQTIYGHFVFNWPTGSVVYWAELWGTAFVVPAGGGNVQLQLQFQDQTCA